jgi:hypothetical protein
MASKIASPHVSRVVKSLLILAVAVLGVITLRAGFATTAPGLYVDAASVGGLCSDNRTADQVGITTPWCSLTKAVASAPAGSLVYVRQATYPATTRQHQLH